MASRNNQDWWWDRKLGQPERWPHTCTMTDLLTALPRELALLVLGYIDARTLFRMERVSKGWRALVADPSRWHELTDELWKDKVRVLRPLLSPKPTRVPRFTCP